MEFSCVLRYVILHKRKMNSLAPGGLPESLDELFI